MFNCILKATLDRWDERPLSVVPNVLGCYGRLSVIKTMWSLRSTMTVS